MKFRILLLLVMVALFGLSSSACDMMAKVENTCSVSGTVYLDGSPMPMPEVLPYDPETGKAINITNDEEQLISRETGFYSVRKLPPGTYKLKVWTRNRKLLTKPGQEIVVELKLGRIEERDIHLSLNDAP